MAVWPGLPEGRDRGDDEAAIQTAQVANGEVESVQSAGLPVLDKHVRHCGQTLKELAACGSGDVQRDAFLAQVDVQEKGAVLGKRLVMVKRP